MACFFCVIAIFNYSDINFAARRLVVVGPSGTVSYCFMVELEMSMLSIKARMSKIHFLKISSRWGKLIKNKWKVFYPLSLTENFTNTRAVLEACWVFDGRFLVNPTLWWMVPLSDFQIIFYDLQFWSFNCCFQSPANMYHTRTNIDGEREKNCCRSMSKSGSCFPPEHSKERNNTIHKLHLVGRW